MKYFGAYTDDADLVPKSYVDSKINEILYSHSEFDINVANRLKQYKNEKEQMWYDWDNYVSSSQVPTGETDHVEILLDPSVRSTSIEFMFNGSLIGNDYPANPTNVTDVDGDPNFPSYTVDNVTTSNTIFYVLGLSHHLSPGQNLFLFMKTSLNLTLSSYKIRVLIPSIFTIPENNNEYYIFYNGKYATNGDLNYPVTRNGFIDLGTATDSFGATYYVGGSLHIYFDGTRYFIDNISGGGTTESSSSQEQPNISHE